MESELTLWAIAATQQLKKSLEDPLLQHQAGGYTFEVKLLNDTLWIVTQWGNNSRSAFRTAYAPHGLEVQNIEEDGKKASISLTSLSGSYKVEIDFPNENQPLLRFTVTFKPLRDLSIPYWPKDVLVYDSKGIRSEPKGDLYVKQIGVRSGLIFAGFNSPGPGSFLYFQNLSSINDYFKATETSAGNTVTGQWPEFGFSLPSTKEKPLPAKKEWVISDAYISFSPETPGDQFKIATQYIDHLATIYRLLPRPETKYQNYPDIVKRSIHDLENNKGCWSQHKGCSYLNAYVCDYETPPEIMVQLAVLLPVGDYSKWAGVELPFANQIYDNVQTFWDEELQTVKRWLPSAEDTLDESEEQKVPNTMDAWYLHHPLLNLARMALSGDKMAKDLFLKSIEYAIKVAHHFDYKWPVFYNMKTLEVLKEETQPGMGGEKDVAGVYAQIMLQAYDLTGEKRFMNEAEKAAQSLAQFGFDIFYQANNTAFSTKSMLRLYKDTGKKIYLDLCHLLIANLLKNVALWECNYGYGENFPLFFGLFPLNDAPYLAVYEEQESFASMHDLLEMAEGTDLSDNARMLLAEYIKYMINRAVYYYPPMLPKEMLSEDVKTGEVDPKLWVALEDIHDGWEQAGVVGQEVYGAGLCFGIVPRHYIRIPGQPFMVFIDYPATSKIKGNGLTVNLFGSSDMTCKLCVIKTDEKAELPQFTVVCGNPQDQERIDRELPENNSNEYLIHGNQTIIIKWTNKK